jgi:hypothetical protein
MVPSLEESNIIYNKYGHSDPTVNEKVIANAILGALRRRLGLSVHIGYADEVDDFLRRNSGIEGIYDEAMLIAAGIFSENKTYSFAPSAVIAFGLISMAYETFLEVFCLAANGFGRGAQGRLRTMFGQIAVAAYITKNENDAEKFIKFQVVESRKELLRAKDVVDRTHNQEFISRIDARLKTLDVDLNRMKGEFGNRFGSSWHDGIAAIAKDLGWEHHFFYSYLIPKRHVHASPLMLERRAVEEDRLYFTGEPDKDGADEAVRGAFTMLVLSYAVAQDIGAIIRNGTVDELSKNLIAFYHGKSNLTRL